MSHKPWVTGGLKESSKFISFIRYDNYRVIQSNLNWMSRAISGDCVIQPSPFTSSNLEYRYKAPLDIPNLHVEYLSNTHCQIRFNENTYLSNLCWWFNEFSDPTYLYLFVKESICFFDKIQIMKKSRSLILSNRPTYGYIHLKFWISIVRAIFVVFYKFHD